MTAKSGAGKREPRARRKNKPAKPEAECQVLAALEPEEGGVRIVKCGSGPDEVTLLVRAATRDHPGSIELILW